MKSVSVIIPTHNPDPWRLGRTLAGLRAQSLSPTSWELLIVDNASRDPAFFRSLDLAWQPSARVVHEGELGLTAARRRGLAESTGEFIVFVDDDNVLARDYLQNLVQQFEIDSSLGAAGGRSTPEFETPPPGWTADFFSLLALRDLGDVPLLARSLRPAGSTRNEYPAFAPIGAGMALRRSAVRAWSERDSTKLVPTDRKGADTASAGDNDIVLSVMRAGWSVGYFPSLSLVHLIPATRLHPEYLARLNRGIQKSWTQVLRLHDACPWPDLTAVGAGLRKFKAWFTYRAWTSPVARIRWQGACGHYDGRVGRLSIG